MTCTKDGDAKKKKKGRSKEGEEVGRQQGSHDRSRLVGCPSWSCHPGQGLLRTCETTAAVFSTARVTFGCAVKLINVLLGQVHTAQPPETRRQSIWPLGFQNRGEKITQLIQCRLLLDKLGLPRKASLNAWDFKMQLQCYFGEYPSVSSDGQFMEGVPGEGTAFSKTGWGSCGPHWLHF